jgi:ketosteroid isomerase-like protein
MGDWADGWRYIWASWREIANFVRGTVRTREIRVIVRGDLAYTVGIEDCTTLVGGKEANWSANVTNVFVRTADGWKLLHHHSDKAPAAERALDEL